MPLILDHVLTTTTNNRPHLTTFFVDCLIHISNIFKENELDKDSVIKDYLTTASDGKPYHVMFYSLPMILAIGYRVKGIRGIQFRRWATEHLSEYLVKGFTMDDERLKNPDGRPDYFDELLLRIRDIHKTDKATQMFFAETQNKLLYAVTSNTAAELAYNRADALKPNMGLTAWKGSIVNPYYSYLSCVFRGHLLCLISDCSG